MLYNEVSNKGHELARYKHENIQMMRKPLYKAGTALDVHVSHLLKK